MPGLAQAFADAPVVPGGNTVRAIDPTCAGLGWDVVERPVDAIMLLVGQPGPSRIRRAADSGMLLRQILEQTVRCVEPTRRIVAEVSKVLRSATLGTLSC